MSTDWEDAYCKKENLVIVLKTYKSAAYKTLPWTVMRTEGGFSKVWTSGIKRDSYMIYFWQTIVYLAKCLILMQFSIFSR